GRVPDYQMSAFLMACFFRGMNEEETFTFTKLMLHSGEVIDLSDIPGVKVDKHSTGGVGDKVSLILAPIVASCGVPVPMISGRGLGHTGGTLDKLESIPGFRTDLSIAEYKRVIRDTGVVMIGQTKEIAPSDKKMYALRDVTATVECIPLIAGSIMSKKLAEGIDALVLDVKTGRGAFMQSRERARELARTLVKIGTQFGKETLAFITDMNQPLGMTIGNWLEVVESVECLRNNRGTEDGSSDLMEVTHFLAGAMLMLGKKAENLEDGVAASREAVRSGRAFQKFLDLVRAQGGDASVFDDLMLNQPAPMFTREVRSGKPGFVTAIDSLELGLASINLGAGRETIGDSIDPKAGIKLTQKVGSRIAAGDCLAVFYTDRESALEPVANRIGGAFTISSQKPAAQPLILDLVDRDGIRQWAV
ncbi:MAG TPA: thymidine phosphorylase, partial [Bacteroidota bacterium]|nr:thymidine phosphorylase [Bacteroidota bacterium]